MKTCLRKFPYPYRCALSVCNDLDGTRPETYLAQHAFLSTSGPTPRGVGLNLDLGNSFWFYNENPHEKNQITYFQHKDLLLPHLKKGELDILHAYGDFNFNPRFTREHAIRALEELKTHHVTVKVWVNHGSEHNLQNVGKGMGDKPFDMDGTGKKCPTPEYHTDLTTQQGVRFFWIDRLTQIVGQDRALPLWEYYFKRKDLSQTKRLILFLSAAVGRLFAETSLARRKLKALMGCDYFGEETFNRLMKAVTLRDGTKGYDFVRFGDHRLATAMDVHTLLNRKTLEDLKASGGSLVLYTHLGKTPPENPLPDEMVDAFRLLKTFSDEKSIWVTRTSRLLTYNMICRGLRWKTQDNQIIIESIDDEVFGRFVPTAEDCEGVTFYVDAPEHISVRIQDRPLKRIQINKPDHTRRPSITL